ncbi:MAG: CHRD domain-containing protein [Geodermatophilaceae bacterium]|nr:CHRD domain-containing protein [Geodermatophilaceae bacterium]
MRKRTLQVALVLASVAVLGATTTASAAAPGVVRTVLTGAAEVPGPGDNNGFGRAVVQSKPLQSQVCVNIRYFGIDAPTGAHIHEAPAGVAGDVVIDFTPLIATSPASYIAGCVSVDTVLARELKQDPEEYYVNVHNPAYPAGAIRGQLAEAA